jgi:hypothetical protein
VIRGQGAGGSSPRQEPSDLFFAFSTDGWLSQAVSLTAEPEVVPDEVCGAILLFNREARVSELILRKFMFSSSWTRAWVLVVVEPVELAEPEDAPLPVDVSPAERISWTRPGFACMMLALSEETRRLYMESVESSDPWLPLSML